MVSALLLLASLCAGGPTGAKGAKSAPAVAALRPQIDTLRGATERKDWPAAVAAARQLESALAAKAPLEIVDIQVLAAPAQGLGIYSPLPDGVVRDGELYLYAQVRNHGLRSVHGWHELHLVSDLIVLDEKGNELARDEGFGESRFSARVPHRDTFVAIALRTVGLPKGKFTLRLVLHDRIGNKSGQAEAIFEIP